MLGIPFPSARLLLLASVLASGCAIDPDPREAIVAADQAIVRALSADATAFASADLDLAREKIALARRWAQAHDHRPARWLAEQAKVDAELAEMRAASARAREAAARETAEFRRINAAMKKD